MTTRKPKRSPMHSIGYRDLRTGSSATTSKPTGSTWTRSRTEEATMFSNNSPEDATPSVSSLLPEVVDQLARVRVVLDNFARDAKPSRDVIDDAEADIAELVYALTELWRALCAPDSDGPPTGVE